MNIKSELAPNIYISGEPFLLKQAISNLIQNSIDFSPPGKTITVRLSDSDENILFEVIDQGAGIPEYAKEKVFEKFFSLRRPESGKKSTGLGLNFVKEIVELHQGWITLENREQGSVTASVSFPMSID